MFVLTHNEMWEGRHSPLDHGALSCGNRKKYGGLTMDLFVRWLRDSKNCLSGLNCASNAASSGPRPSSQLHVEEPAGVAIDALIETNTIPDAAG
jgi:hypothetical protein